jgi:hypothetical protein
MFYIVIVVVALVAVYFIFGDNIKSLFAGNPLASEVKKIQEDVKSVLDVNKDGKVDVADAKEAVKKTATKVKAVETKVKASAKKMTSKKKK